MSKEAVEQIINGFNKDNKTKKEGAENLSEFMAGEANTETIKLGAHSYIAQHSI
jgi:hypothetical protein